MPWAAIIVAFITYLLQNPKNSKERKNALLTSAAAGVGTYMVGEYTEWGQENIGAFDQSVSEFFTGKPGEAAKPENNSSGTPSSGAKPAESSANGLWSTLQSWGGLGTAAVIGTTSAATGLAPSWLKWALIGGAAYLLLRD